MRKLLPTIFLAALGTTPLVAQAGLGVVGGYVSSKVSEDPAVAGLTWAGRSGAAGGLSFHARLASGISFGVEGLYVQKGSDAHVGAASASEKLAYVEVPVLLRIAIGNTRRPHLFITGGGQYSFLQACTQVAPGVADVDCKKTSTDTSGVKMSDYGVVVGGGVASGRFSLSVRYDLGLANISNDRSSAGGSLAGPSTFKNRAVMALLGISLGK